MAADQYVIVTRYVRPADREVIVHVYGSWPTRARAETEARQMKAQDADWHSVEGVGAPTFYVRKVLIEHREDAR